MTMFMDGLKCKCEWRDSSEAEGLLNVVASEYTGTDMDGGGGIVGVLLLLVVVVVVLAELLVEREEAAVERKRAIMESVNRMLILLKTRARSFIVVPPSVCLVLYCITIFDNIFCVVACLRCSLLVAFLVDRWNLKRFGHNSKPCSSVL